MTIEVTEILTEEQVEALLEKVEPAPKLFDAKKYFNKIKIEGDPLEIQQGLRDEQS
jgi:hypothetical protein